MPVVRSITLATPVVALAISDVHLSLKPPLARAEEKNWLLAMDRTFMQVKELAQRHQCPILCAGDVFDRWNSPPELINWAWTHFPQCYAIPGNHDLPSHRPELAHRSAYGTLARTGTVSDLGEGYQVASVKGLKLALYANALNGPIPKRLELGSGFLHVLVTHRYLWIPGKSYHGAPREARLGTIAHEFKGFDTVVVGDNHMAFRKRLKSGTWVVNCGTLLRRKSSEADYTPSVALIHADGSVRLHPLDVSKDVLTHTVAELEDLEDEDLEASRAFVEGLAKLEGCSLSFREVVTRYMKAEGVSKRVKRLVLEAMDGK